MFWQPGIQAVFALLLAVCFQAQGSDELAVNVVKREGAFVFSVDNVADPESAVVKVWLGSANVNVDPPMMGKSAMVDGELIFKPRFPLRADTEFNVGIQLEHNLKPSHFTVRTPAVERVKTKIEAVFPSSDVLPENTLKFYISFSSPMRKGDIYEFVKLRKVDGPEIDIPFLEIEQELWSRDSTRLTLLLDPGRIKRGLKPREEMGPIFVSGQAYELVIDGAWPNADGVELGEAFIKKFRASDEDHTQPDPADWEIIKPKVASSDPLVLEFAESLDYSMLQSVIQVIGADGKQIVGETRVSNEEEHWSFVPDSAWQPGSYRILVDSNLEDNAGNSIGRQFDVDVFNRTEEISGETVELKFDL